MKSIGIGLMAAVMAMAADVDIYTPQEMQAVERKLAEKGAPFAAQPLEKYPGHYTMIAYRAATGSSEVHEKEADIFVAVKGSASIITGGKLVNSRVEKPGELRGTSIEGGERHALPEGSIIHIPAGTPHQLIVEKGQPFTYFVVKVVEK